MKFNYDQKKFRLVSSSSNSELADGIIFRYEQTGRILKAGYSNDQVILGQLLGVVAEDGSIEMRYHQVNSQHELMTGTCQSQPELLSNGKIRLHEKWQWTSGDQSEGESILEEI